MTAFYLLFNLSIATGYGIFWVWDRTTSRVAPQMCFRNRLKWGQILFTASLLAPVVVSLLPDQTARQISAIILPPLPEGDSGSDVRRLRPVRRPPVKTSPVAQARGNALLRALPQLSLSAIISLVALALLFKIRLVLQVCRLLNRSISIRRLGRVSIATSSEIAVPFSTLLGNRAWIVVPDSMIESWNDYKLAVKHELQHHRNGDTAWAIFIDFVTATFVLNPFAYFWKRRISELQEFSCDEALIGREVSSYEYGSCLVRVAETALEHRTVLVGTASMAAGFEHPTYFKSFLRRRINMLTQHKSRRPCRLAGFLTGTFAMVSTLALALGAEQTLNEKKATIAKGVVVTDPEIQNIAQTALHEALKRYKASLGFVVVADPNSGQILAVANEDLVDKQTARTPHWALSLKVGPASIVKAFVAAAAIDRGATTVDENHNCEKGKYLLEGQLIQDWRAFDTLSTAESVIQSSNICGIKVGQKLGAKGLAAAFRTFGFGSGGTADGFPEARPGDLIRPASTSPTDEALYVGTVSTGYGGLFLSPLEIVQAMGAIANGGNLIKPQSGKGSAPVILHRVISESSSSKMKSILEQVMVSGTAAASHSRMYRLAGKTGTGYSRTHVGHDTLGGEANIASFVGFGPVENPRVVVYVVVENPSVGDGVHGSAHAAPVFREVAERTLQYLKVAAQ